MAPPKTGIKIVEEYEYVVGNYFEKKELQKEERLKEIRNEQKKAVEAVQENRKRYEKLKNKEVFRPQNLKGGKIKEARIKMMKKLLNKEEDRLS